MPVSCKYRKIVKAAALLTCTIWACAATTLAQPEQGAEQKKPFTAQDKEKKKVFTEEDERVEQIPGKWRLASGLDMQQTYDFSVPVIVREITTSYGQGKYAGRVKMTEAKLENRVQKTTRSVQLRWAIVMFEEPDTVLLEGVVPPFEVRIEPNSEPLLVDIPHIYFNKIVRPLLKDGEISGHLQLVVGVQEVRFADGTLWRRTQQAAFLRASFSRPRLISSHGTSRRRGYLMFHLG